MAVLEVAHSQVAGRQLQALAPIVSENKAYQDGLVRSRNVILIESLFDIWLF